MEVIFSIIAVLSLVFCVVIIVDRTIFTRKIKEIEVGMTGKEVEEAAGYPLQIVSIEGTSYQAVVRSFLTIFKYRLIFYNGKLVTKQRE